MKEARLVCKLWSKCGWKKLQAISKTSFFCDDKKIAEFIEFFKRPNAPNPPPQNFYFYLVEPDDKILTKFYQEYGSQIKILDTSGYRCVELDRGDQATLTNLEHFTFNFVETEFPIHENLILKGSRPILEVHETAPPDDDNDLALTHFTAFLKRNANLVELKFHDEHGIWYENTKSAPLPLIQGIIAGLANLEVLSLPLCLDSECYEELANNGKFKLKSFNTSFSSKLGATFDSFYKFLNLQRGSLENLSVHFEEDATIIPDNFWSKFDNICKLELYNVKTSLTEVLNPQQFPVLTKLKVSQLIWIAPEADDIIEANLTIKTLKAYFESFEHTEQDITTFINFLGKITPNLTKLYLCGYLRKDHIELCRKNLKYLKKLDLGTLQRRTSAEQDSPGVLKWNDQKKFEF